VVAWEDIEVKVMTDYAKIAWRPGDVQSLAPQLSDQRAEEFLRRNEKRIQDALISHGHVVIEALLTEAGIATGDDEE